MFRCHECGAINRVPAERWSAGPLCGRCKQALDTSGKPQEVSGEELARAISSSPIPVLVDFWAGWCQPCRFVAPILDEVSRLRAGRLLSLKLDTEREPHAASAHDVRALPTFVLFRGGHEVARRSGAMARGQLLQWLESEQASVSAHP